jgi:hypothetical protein
MSESYALLEGGSVQGNERQDIEGAEPGMNTVVMVQVNEFDGFCGEANRRLNHRLSMGNERDDASVMVSVAGPVKNVRARHSR